MEVVPKGRGSLGKLYLLFQLLPSLPLFPGHPDGATFLRLPLLPCLSAWEPVDHGLKQKIKVHLSLVKLCWVFSQCRNVTMTSMHRLSTLHMELRGFICEEQI